MSEIPLNVKHNWCWSGVVTPTLVVGDPVKLSATQTVRAPKHKKTGVVMKVAITNRNKFVYYVSWLGGPIEAYNRRELKRITKTDVATRLVG